MTVRVVIRTMRFFCSIWFIIFYVFYGGTELCFQKCYVVYQNHQEPKKKKNRKKENTHIQKKTHYGHIIPITIFVIRFASFILVNQNTFFEWICRLKRHGQCETFQQSCWTVRCWYNLVWNAESIRVVDPLMDDVLYWYKSYLNYK